MFKVDLRSDTVTRPDEAMRRAMAQAEVGDDVFGEDPTINALQEKAAELVGKEAALFVPSGTMANQVGLRILTQPGNEVICDAFAHSFRNEGGAGVVLSGLSFFTLPGDQGRISPEQVLSAIQPDNIHLPISRVVSIENTHNRGNGSVYDLGDIKKIAAIAKDNGLAMHLDGARMFHACLAGGYAPTELASHFDVLGFCLSKGLGAPVGSIVASSKELITKAVRVRKQFGGGMRQAGILAAAGLHALNHNLERLAEDHARAGALARGLAEIKGVSLDPAQVQTNIVIFSVKPSGQSPQQVCEALATEGVGVLPFGGDNIRAVMHLHITDADVDAALAAFNKVLG